MTVKHLLEAVGAGLRKVRGAAVIREGSGTEGASSGGMGHPGVGVEAVPLSLGLRGKEL